MITQVGTPCEFLLPPSGQLPRRRKPQGDFRARIQIRKIRSIMLSDINIQPDESGMTHGAIAD